MKQKILQLLALFLIAVALNGVWEFSHQGLYLVDGGAVPTTRLLQSILGDGVIVVALFLIARRRYASVALLGLLIAITVEIHAVYFAHWWEYRSSMPLIWGLGLTPLLQMILLPSISIWLMDRLFGTVGSKIVARF